MLQPEITPFRQYILKVASRCNLNCDYCFVYNQGDTNWRRQPVFMTMKTLTAVCNAIGTHCQEYGLNKVSIIFHGGEPLLVGAARLGAYSTLIRGILPQYGVQPDLGMQSNGTLFTEAIGDECLNHNISIGISTDGPPVRNDVHRIDHAGRGSSDRVEASLSLLTSSRYRRIFSGFLAVVDLDTDPVQMFKYLESFGPRSINILLPYDNHDRLPKGKYSPRDTFYGEWMVRLFDYWWYQTDGKVSVRTFESILRILMGHESLVEGVGLGSVELIVVETNGEIEAVDSLKASYDGAAGLGCNVFDHTFTEVAALEAIRARQLGATTLCRTCRECACVAACGGGYLPNRYSRQNGFDNTSVYCGDSEYLIHHIEKRLAQAVRSKGRLNGLQLL